MLLFLFLPFLSFFFCYVFTFNLNIILNCYLLAIVFPFSLNLFLFRCFCVPFETFTHTEMETDKYINTWNEGNIYYHWYFIYNFGIFFSLSPFHLTKVSTWNVIFGCYKFKLSWLLIQNIWIKSKPSRVSHSAKTILNWESRKNWHDFKHLRQFLLSGFNLTKHSK